MIFKLSTRQMIVAVFGLIAVLCTIMATVNSKITGSLSSIDLSLMLVGISAWSIAAGHGLYRAYRKNKQEIDTEKDPPIFEEDKQTMSVCTQSKINSGLLMTCSTSFLISASSKLATPTTPIITQSLSSLFWLKSSALSYLLAQEQSKKEKDITFEVKPCGVKHHDYKLIIATEFFAAGILSAIAIYSDSSIDFFKATGNLFWLFSALHDTGQVIYERQKNLRMVSQAPKIHVNNPIIKIAPHPGAYNES